MTRIEIFLDTAEATKADAAHLRAIADVIDPQTTAAEACAGCPATATVPPRFRHVIDRGGDHGIQDTLADRVADFMTRPGSPRHAHMLEQLARLNAGTLAPGDVTYDGDDDDSSPSWGRTSLMYPPYQEATTA